MWSAILKVLRLLRSCCKTSRVKSYAIVNRKISSGILARLLQCLARVLRLLRLPSAICHQAVHICCVAKGGFCKIKCAVGCECKTLSGKWRPVNHCNQPIFFSGWWDDTIGYALAVHSWCRRSCGFNSHWKSFQIYFFHSISLWAYINRKTPIN